MRKLFYRLILIGLLPDIACAASLPDTVSAALDRAHIPLSSVGIVVREVNDPSPLISVNADQAMNPASTMKLLTTFAALDTLGPSYRWKTEAYLNGVLENGVLQGDLVFKGYGDPKLTIEQFWLWLKEIRHRGLREIHGDIVLDNSYFEDKQHDPSAFDNDPTRAYNVGTSATLINFNAIHIRLVPDGKKTIALLVPELAGYTIHNQITTSEAMPCGGEKLSRARLNGQTIELEGRVPAACGDIDEYFSLLPHDNYFLAVFGALWQELGGTLQGGLRSGAAPVGQQPYSTYVSPPLSEVIRDINKFSNNSMAQQLFLALGIAESPATAASNMQKEAVQMQADYQIASSFAPEPESTRTEQLINGGDFTEEESVHTSEMTVAVPQPANLERSIAKMYQWLKEQKLQFPELVLENGSGLSRKERISALHLAELLQRAMNSPFYAELVSSLPISGLDGTVKKRFTDGDMTGYAHLKTGSLKGVKSIAGYVQARSGKRWIVVFLVNHPRAARSEDAQEALVAWLRDEY